MTFCAFTGIDEQLTIRLKICDGANEIERDNGNEIFAKGKKKLRKLNGQQKFARNFSYFN